MLTNKCANAFAEYCIKNKISVDKTNVTCYYAVLVDFFDSVGFIINTNNVMDDWWFVIKRSNHKAMRPEHFYESKTRYEALRKAFLTANEAYNSEASFAYYNMNEPESLYKLSKINPDAASDILVGYYTGAEQVFLDKDFTQYNIMTRLLTLAKIITRDLSLLESDSLELIDMTEDLFSSQIRRRFIEHVANEQGIDLSDKIRHLPQVNKVSILKVEIISSYECVLHKRKPELDFIVPDENKILHRKNGFSTHEAILLLTEEFRISPLYNKEITLNYYDPEYGIVDSDDVVVGKLDVEVLERISSRWVICNDDIIKTSDI